MLLIAATNGEAGVSPVTLFVGGSTAGEGVRGGRYVGGNLERYDMWLGYFE